ncbi:hypothetical protein DI005_28535 [Prauserella sp. PE36]|nr:hypothetical protein DI005_28535 [Prauserella sp. PE36]
MTVTVFGGHVPLSVWTLAVLVVGTLVSVLLARQLARRTNWSFRATLVTLLLFTAALAVTLTPGAEQHRNGVLACLPDDFTDLTREILHSGGGVAGDLLNLVLLLPLAGAIVVTTRRVLPGVALALLLPLVIEAAQTQLAGRYCSLSDLVANISGALLGVAFGSFVLRRVGDRGGW